MRRWLADLAGVWLMIALAVGVPLLLLGQALDVRVAGSDLRFSAPSLRFLESGTLDRLRDGASVPLQFALTVSEGNRLNVVRRISERVVVSYDLWEETYSVVNPTRNTGPANHRSTTGAEAWCIDQISLPVAGLSANKPLYFRLEIKPELNQPASDSDSGVSLRGLIEVFGRTRDQTAPRHILETGPLGLNDLRRVPPPRQ